MINSTKQYNVHNVIHQYNIISFFPLRRLFTVYLGNVVIVLNNKLVNEAESAQRPSSASPSSRLHFGMVITCHTNYTSCGIFGAERVNKG